MAGRTILTAALLASLATGPLAVAQQSDPLNSPMWDYNRQIFLGAMPWQFDERVVVEVPEFAEDPTQVPITIDAAAFAGDIQKVIAWADLNPIQHIFTLYPTDEANPRVSLRIKVQQATPVRAAVLTGDGVWHVGGAELDAAGGGCTAPSVGNADPYWESHLGEIASRRFSNASSSRYRFKVIHPMDTGLVNNIPEFFLEQLEVRDEAGTAVVKMELYPPVSENPVFTFDLKHNDRSHSLWMRDNSGNEFEQAL